MHTSKPLQPTSVKLYAANGSEINAYGILRRRINLGLRRNFEWSFMVADVSTPIIGSDFIRHYDLTIDLKRNKLIDKTTNLEVPCTIRTGLNMQIKAFDHNDPFAKLLADFKDLTEMTSDRRPVNTDVHHVIETSGQPVNARVRKLDLEKLAAAKAEFEYLMRIGVCRPSK
ncbi:uncharacterized protein LOC118755928, partial [Rhagoletis pomonella]|uniref:uncharacterized protein LOC118755928 n=1 Tax=Rhagoletis pomonella TaxID=28610 RepID=UPI001784436A